MTGEYGTMLIMLGKLENELFKSLSEQYKVWADEGILFVIHLTNDSRFIISYDTYDLISNHNVHYLM